MINYQKNSSCTVCRTIIDLQVLDYSLNKYHAPLCRRCQYELNEKLSQTTPETLTLYLQLRAREVPAELEKFDGHKTIDIAVTDARVNIEVDGSHHNFNHLQALADLKRTYYAFRKGYLTLRIPNSLIRSHLEETADLITEFLNENKERRYSH